MNTKINEPFLMCVAAGMAGIYECGIPNPWPWVMEMSSDEIIITQRYYWYYLEGRRKGLEEGTMTLYDPVADWVCNTSTVEYWKRYYAVNKS